MFAFQFSCLFIIFISCSHSFIILQRVEIKAQEKIDYLKILSDETVSLFLSDVNSELLTFMILDTDGKIIKSITRPFADYDSVYSILALHDGIVFEIYDKFLNLIKGPTTVKYSDTSKKYISKALSDTTVFNLKNNGLHIFYQRNESIQYINFYDQNGNFVSNSPETFPASRSHQTLQQVMKMPGNNILYIDQDTFKLNNEERCISEFNDWCDHKLKYVKSKTMKNGMVLINWIREDDLSVENEVYFIILDGSCSKLKKETKIGITVGEPKIECLENGNCIIIYLKIIDIKHNIYEIVLKIIDSTTNVFSEEIKIATAWALDYTVTSYSNSNFMIVWTDISNNQIVGRVYSLDCLEYVGEICKSCANSKVLSEKGKACVTAIEGCIEYSANGKCKTCGRTLIKNVNGSLCFIPINYCLKYSDAGFCDICQDGKALTIGKIACVPKIISCLEYKNNGECKTSDSPKVFQVSNKFYVAPIKDCSTHSNNGLCQSCNSPKKLTVGMRACVSEIKGCLTYSDDGLCQTCLASNQMTVGKKCVPQIQSCLLYADNEKCLSCIKSHRLIQRNTACGPIIAGCVLYSTDGQICLNCAPSKKLIEGGMACRKSIIEGCTIYSSKNICLNCISSKVLTNEKTACVNPIQDCIEYTVKGKCLACNKKVLSLDKKKCFAAISGCLKYSDSKCNTCISGKKLSSDKLFCLEVSKNKVISKISVNISDNLTNNGSSNNQKTFFLKDEIQTMEINSRNDMGYAINLNNSSFLLIRSNSSHNIHANVSYKNSNTLVLTFNLSHVPTGTYSFKFDLSFLKKTQTIIQDKTDETLPEYFVFTYQPQKNVFICNDEEVLFEILSNNRFDQSFCENLLSLSVFGVALATVFLLHRKLQQNKPKMENKIEENDQYLKNNRRNVVEIEKQIYYWVYFN